MASYDIEHSVPPSTSNTIPTSTSSSTPHHPAPPHRPDFSTFFSHLSNTTTSTTSTRNPHATPMPTDISALYRLLAEGYNSTRQSRLLSSSRSASTPTTTTTDNDSEQSSPLLNDMITLLISEANHPPPPSSSSSGASQEYIDSLERVPKHVLRRGKGMGECPICGGNFAEEEFPLVVRLPCDKGGRHVFDLECIAPWLRVHATCPLDRKDLLRREEEAEVLRGRGEGEEEEEEDGEWDDMYA